MKSKTKTEFGADKEADHLLEKLPRKFPKTPNAFLLIDASGSLQIWLGDGGVLTLKEKDLAYLHGDELV